MICSELPDNWREERVEAVLAKPTLDGQLVPPITRYFTRWQTVAPIGWLVLPEPTEANRHGDRYIEHWNMDTPNISAINRLCKNFRQKSKILATNS